ncbi:MAG: hypothetical protein MPF33_11125, partial [Candidatus Aramenus sp.]|nr:hypothetical protein [Candidatus Aramenus sp.]
MLRAYCSILPRFLSEERTSTFQERIAELDELKSETEKVQEQEAREEVLRERERLFSKIHLG